MKTERKGPRVLKDQLFDDRSRFQRFADARNWAIYDQVTGKVDWWVVILPGVLILVGMMVVAVLALTIAGVW